VSKREQKKKMMMMTVVLIYFIINIRIGSSIYCVRRRASCFADLRPRVTTMRDSLLCTYCWAGQQSWWYGLFLPRPSRPLERTDRTNDTNHGSRIIMTLFFLRCRQRVEVIIIELRKRGKTKENQTTFFCHRSRYSEKPWLLISLCIYNC